MRTLSQPVSPERLHPCCDAIGRLMLRVVSTLTQDASPDVSTIFVKEIEWAIPSEPGEWEPSGSDIIYEEPSNERHEEEKVSSCTCDQDGHHKAANLIFYPTLSDFLDSFAGGEFDNEVNIIVNPHGRNVMKYCFNGGCPVCNGWRWTCPGCLGASYPDIRGSCGVDLSCPACMGYDFALDDHCRIRDIDRLKWRLESDEPVPEKDRQRFEDDLEEVVQLTRERYEVINDRLGEMGFELVNVDEEVKKAESHNREELPWLVE